MRWPGELAASAPPPSMRKQATSAHPLPTKHRFTSFNISLGIEKKHLKFEQIVPGVDDVFIEGDWTDRNGEGGRRMKMIPRREAIEQWWGGIYREWRLEGWKKLWEVGWETMNNI